MKLLDKAVEGWIYVWGEKEAKRNRHHLHSSHGVSHLWNSLQRIWTIRLLTTTRKEAS